MINRNTAATAFWSSKLGHAAMASIAAMVLMIALSSQIHPGSASATPIAAPAAETGGLIEIA
jgi:hypothetical protein